MTPEPLPDIAPPLEITAFLDRLHAAGQRIVPGSAKWIEYAPDRWVLVVRVENQISNVSDDERKL